MQALTGFEPVTSAIVFCDDDAVLYQLSYRTNWVLVMKAE